MSVNGTELFGRMRGTFLTLMSCHCRVCFVAGRRDTAFITGELPTTGTILADASARREVARRAVKHYEAEHAAHPMMRHAPWRNQGPRR